MRNCPLKHDCALAITPSSRGFGFAVLGGGNTLVDWGVKAIKGDKNSQSLEKVGQLLQHYRPTVLVLHDYSTKNSRRSSRVQSLGRDLVTMAKGSGLRLRILSRAQVSRAFCGHEAATKREVAELIANRFPEELGSRLPPKRRPWMSEDSRMDIFDAVALVIGMQKKRRRNDDS